MENNLNVIVVDDSAVERSMVLDHLSKYSNLKVKEFANGEFLIRELIVGHVQEPDLILLDYFLDAAPGGAKDGLEILNKLKEIAPNTKVIMMTSVTNERIKELANQKGALDYVVKGAQGFDQLDSVLSKHGFVKTVAA